MADLSDLIQNRYGSTVHATSHTRVNETLKTILSHKSVRHFLPNEPVDLDTLRTIVAAAQSAPSSSNLQTWSVIAIQDPQQKDKAASLAGNQAFIRQAPVFLVFCADLNRLTSVSHQQGKPGLGLEYTEMFLVSSVDASLAAQNALIAAESLGLGACYVGAVRNHAHDMATLLNLPQRVAVLFGMAIGIPDPSYAATAAVKPRLPQSQVLHFDAWPDTVDTNGISEYDEIMAKFNADQKRGDLPKWTQASSDRVASAEALSGRHVLHETLTNRGFSLK